jgi:flagellar protein FliO/FliZ
MGAGQWIQGALALLAVLALVALAAWAARRTGLARPVAGAVLKPVATLAVGARERVVVVEVRGRWLVLGVAAGSVRALADLEPGELPAAAPAPAFADWLSRARTARRAP